MIYALAVHGAPYSSNAAAHALGFADALLARGHQIERVFFFHEGVYQGLNSHVPPQTRYNVNLATRWKSLSEGGTELAICIASGIKRGIVDATEQARYDLPSDTLSNTFELVGLGQLIGAIATADRYVEFPA